MDRMTMERMSAKWPSTIEFERRLREDLMTERLQYTITIGWGFILGVALGYL